MTAAHPFGAFVGCRFKRIGCIRQIKFKTQWVYIYAHCALKGLYFKIVLFISNRTLALTITMVIKIIQMKLNPIYITPTAIYLVCVLL